MNKFPYLTLLVLSLLTFCKVSFAALPETIEKIKPSIVGIGTHSRLASPNTQLRGTGFVIGNGQFVATNAHVIPDVLNSAIKEKLVVLAGTGRRPNVKFANVVALDKSHDLAILKISGKKLKPLTLSDKTVREGESIAFTGFPIGSVLGLYPVTHRGIISSITPIVIPAKSSRDLTITQLKQLKDPYMVYQLDATAYPGNSGSPVYSQDTGQVIAVINKVLVKTTKENVLSDPSAITYSIPIRYLIELFSTVE
ncbi:serine protease [Vibrio sp. HN007]|uniref:S1 family peptidase n=1 Tax=Vibrio iocasae TaxID=3098914 RepID=UPI0035D485C3